MAKRGRRKATTKKNSNGANLGFEQKLWLAADKLRGHIRDGFLTGSSNALKSTGRSTIRPSLKPKNGPDRMVALLPSER